MVRYSKQVYEGMDVFDANDEKIGTVDEILDAAAGRASASGGRLLTSADGISRPGPRAPHPVQRR
jgi:hypothetical protein